MPILQDADSMLMFHAELDCGEGSEKTSEQAPHKGQARSGPESVRELSGLQGAPFELDAIELVIRLNKQYLKLRTHIVHLSAADALPLIQEAQTVGGLPLTTETCLHYLTLSTEEIPDGRAEYKCCPPIRTAANQESGLQPTETSYVRV
ncbi:hypothetical protein Pst134EA_032509 [Puccinia striiformis f. sp. tritici]|nr:uncharacterized protein Pst134EA_032509 [Puccinia striiformis f. sp. tritici]KAH9441730.1 hypothetical protein Pst134EA_032509 [Puccinia striiformis f. sp. tritici]